MPAFGNSFGNTSLGLKSEDRAGQACQYAASSGTSDRV